MSTTKSGSRQHHVLSRENACYLSSDAGVYKGNETFCRSLRSRKPWGKERYTYQNHMVELVINSLHLVIIA